LIPAFYRPADGGISLPQLFGRPAKAPAFDDGDKDGYLF
jgi:hypothetical protein